MLNLPPVKYVVITHGHWDHFLGMNEFGATVIVNRLTDQIIKEWQSYSFDDEALQGLVDANLINAKCVEIVKDEIPNRDLFKLNNPDIVFEDSLSIDLGNKVCIVERIRSTHTDDSTVVYVPDEKVLFLGDSGYGTTTDSLFHYKQSLLLPMIEDIEKYDAAYFLFGHETICDLDEMNLYWKELLSTNKVTNSTSLEEAVTSFEEEYRRSPNENERFFLKAFVNDQIINSSK
ncbi:Zn-dependent hydrolase [Bacillus sp. JCM 19046]|nr:Zn-dependent hydrolase [Bacillus sp. JCM 19046]